MRHNIAPIRVPEEIHRRRLAALDELLGRCRGPDGGRRGGAGDHRMGHEPAAIRRCREDLAAAEARREVLLYARTLIARTAAAERGQAA
jgi:hypothetical protein